MRFYMKPDSKYSLQRTMIIYFLLIGFASLLVGIEFVAETNGPELRDALIDNIERYSAGETDINAVFSPIDRLRNKAILMIIIIMTVMIIVLTMFIKNITEPLQHMIEISKKISTGDLSLTIRIRSHNELAELGNVINEMSSNLQEIIHISRNICSSGREIISKTDMIGQDINISREERAAGIDKEMKMLRNEFDLLDEVIEYFDFYTVGKKPPVNND